MMIVSFLFFTLVVALISYLKTKDEDLKSTTGYFLAGRSLPWFVIAGSLFLTNISAEQLTGLNGNAFQSGANVMAWETVASITLVVLAVVFLPRFLKGGITTVPQFLEARYGSKMRIISSFIFLYAIIIGFLPFVLYAGAITLGKLFGIAEMFHVSQVMATWIMIIGLGVIGGVYAIFGGLKAVAISDTVNGVGLIIGGFLIPILALNRLGDGSIIAGFSLLIHEAPERMSAMGIDKNASVPWHTLFTGILLINLFYWCTNQAIIQRSLGAKSLAEGQKGVLATALLKIFGVMMLVLPGVIAWHMQQKGLIHIPVKSVTAAGVDILNKDMAYPTLVQAVLPTWLTGFFGAVLFGAVLSSFNSGVNSLSTLASLDIYKQLINKQATDQQTVRFGQWFGTVTIIICIFIAPYIATADGLYTLMRTIMAVINVPIFAVVIMGVLSKRAPALSGYIALPIGMVFFYFANFVFKNNFGLFHLHWLHTVGLNFILMMAIMTAVRYWKPLKTPYVQVYTQEVDIVPWKHVKLASWCIIALLTLLYSVFSKIGILGHEGSLFKVIGVLLAVTAICALGSWLVKLVMNKQPI